MVLPRSGIGEAVSEKPHAAWPERSEGNWDVRIDTRRAVDAMVFGPFLKKLVRFHFSEQVGTINAVGCHYFTYSTG